MDAFMKMIMGTEPNYKKNYFWSIKDGVIYDEVLDKPFCHKEYNHILRDVLEYFKTVYTSLQTECQVLVLTKTDARKLDTYKIPEIPCDTYSILVLPQENTVSHTSISEEFWHNVIEKNNIMPLFRVHSHHNFDAYQSVVDWRSLNSNTLEIVLGKIFEPDPQIAYWLDERGKDTKNTYYTSTMGDIEITANKNQGLGLLDDFY